MKYFGSVILLLAGLYGVTVKKSLAKIVIGIAVIELAADLFLSGAGDKNGGASLILPAAAAVGIALAVRLRERYETSDITKIGKLKG